MMHMDLNTTNAIVAARQETVRRMILASQHPGSLMSTIGVLLIRLGERLQRDMTVTPTTQGSIPTRKRPQLA